MVLTPPVVLTGSGLLDGHGRGARYVLEGEQVRRVGVLQRRRGGQRVDVVDGRGIRLHCKIAAVLPGRLELDVLERVAEPAPAVRLVLVQALTVGHPDELAIGAATEAGVDDVVPWQARRSVVVWRGQRAATSRAAWLAVVREATERSRRAFVPAIAEPVDTAGLAGYVGGVVAGGGAAFVLHASAPASLARLPLPAACEAARVVVVVGPEGGIAQEEHEALIAAGATAARLGPHVMSTSTAGPVAVALLAQRLGRWADREGPIRTP